MLQHHIGLDASNLKEQYKHLSFVKSGQRLCYPQSLLKGKSNKFKYLNSSFFGNFNMIKSSDYAPDFV